MLIDPLLQFNVQGLLRLRLQASHTFDKNCSPQLIQLVAANFLQININTLISFKACIMPWKLPGTCNSVFYCFLG